MQEQQSVIGAASWSPPRRLINSLGFSVCGVALGFAYFFFQGYLGLEPCPLCIFQRVAMFATGLVFLAAALHGPGLLGARIYAVLILLTAGTGAAIAARHVWLQHLPPERVPACGPSLEYMLETLPIGQTIRKVLIGTGDCALIDWTFLGLSIPGWTLVIFVGLGLLGAVRNWIEAT